MSDDAQITVVGDPSVGLAHRLDRLREGFAGFLSTLAAAAAPAALIAAYVHAGSDGRPGTALVAFCMAFLLAFAHAVILGLPAALVLVHKRRFRAFPMLVAGGVVGLLPSAVIFFPDRSSAEWSGYLAIIAVTSTLGAVGGLAFYLAHRMISPEREFCPGREASD
ncbi:hypothetical protein [Marilutibacter chinensis]|uniref:Uncharacterized protein n=1 Tax=Marilutibacter chinensis TaxID=2912247 RepID=A0ABS9HX85_9GAMM|nr:hypothetical protein [Lysobacter chinensis]MCF7222933.1 hypothetical protein [Lysobacter chinensis]